MQSWNSAAVYKHKPRLLGIEQPIAAWMMSKLNKQRAKITELLEGGRVLGKNTKFPIIEGTLPP